MFLLKKTELFSVVGVSFGGGVAHNLGQLLVAAVVVESYDVFYYVPVLIIAGLLTGAAIGFVAREMLKRLQKLLI